MNFQVEDFIKLSNGKSYFVGDVFIYNDTIYAYLFNVANNEVETEFLYENPGLKKTLLVRDNDLKTELLVYTTKRLSKKFLAKKHKY